MSNTEKNNDAENKSNTENIVIKKSTYYNILKGIVIALVIISFLGGYSLGTFDDSSSFTKDDLKYILSNIESVPPSPQPTRIPSPPTQIIEIILDDDEPFKGKIDAPITIVEFSDFQCPFCSRFAEQTLPLLEENYIDTGKIKFIYQDFPLANIHPNAKLTHIAAECADEQEKFWEYHDMLFVNQRQWSSLNVNALDSQLKQYANTLGLNPLIFESCLGSSEIASEIDEDILQGTQYGATGTPTFFIGTSENGYVKLVGAQPYAVFQSIIDDHLK